MRSRTAAIGAVLLTAAIGGLMPASASAQGTAATSPEAPKFEGIRTPTSPAFTLLGVEPSSVERPNSPSELAASFVSSADGFDSVPEDFALEVSPYWLRNHRRLSWRDEASRTWIQSLMRTSTFSIATTASGTEEAPVTSLAIGARASVVSGHLSAKAVKQIETLEELLAKESAFGNELMKVQLAEAARLLITKAITKEQHDELLKTIVSNMSSSDAFALSPQVKARKKAVENLASDREGLIIELAGAAGWAYPNAVWNSNEFDRWAFWVTPSYEGGKGSLIGVLRYTSKDPAENLAALDYGVRVLRSVDRYAFSMEYVRRNFRESELENRYRLVGMVEYNVGAGHWMVASFGRDHNTTSEGSLVARLGLTFNFSEERYKQP